MRSIEVHDSINNPSPFPFLLFLPISKKKHQLKTFLTFFTFYITSTIFYYYLNKKIHYKTKKNLLFHINYLYFISHQSLFTHTQKKNSPIKKGDGDY
jgi:hypothetical protein